MHKPGVIGSFDTLLCKTTKICLILTNISKAMFQLHRTYFTEISKTNCSFKKLESQSVEEISNT